MAKKIEFEETAKLRKAIERSRQATKRYREERRAAVLQYAGSHYADGGSEVKMPVNLLAMYCDLMVQKLVPKNPRVMLSTFNKQDTPAVKVMEDWIVDEIERLDLAGELSRVVMDALFWIGIMKVGIATPADAALYSWTLKGGTPFAARVDPEDFFCDMNAKDFRQCSFIGHRIRIPLDSVKDSEMYGPGKKDLTATVDIRTNQQGDERIKTIGTDDVLTDLEDFMEFTELLEVYIPSRRLIVTIPDDMVGGDDGDEPLLVQEWLGPDCGPYHFLSFGTVPGNLMPKGPVCNLVDINDSLNLLYRKMIDQAERTKELLMVQGGATKDGETIQKADDGDVIRVDNPQATQSVVMGGAVQSLTASVMHFFDIFDRLAGNLSMLGGLGPQSKTLGQDKLLQEQAGGTVTDKQQSTLKHVAYVMRSMCWFWWHDPRNKMRTNYQVQGAPEITTTRTLHPGTHPNPRDLKRSGRYDDMQIKIDPYSMQHQTPQMRIQSIMSILKEVFIPLQPFMQQGGVVLDAHAILAKLAKYSDNPDIADILTYQEPPSDPGGGSSTTNEVPANMPNETTRNYVRENRPGQTRRGQDSTMMQTLMGGRQQDSQMGKVGLPTG